MPYYHLTLFALVNTPFDFCFIPRGFQRVIKQKNASGLQYLELQARKEEANGWNKASFFEMANRFRFIKKHAVFGETYEVDSVAIEVDSLYNELNKDEFETLLGYINTEAAKQQKGGGGNAK